jgi:hypothetical protein
MSPGRPPKERTCSILKNEKHDLENGSSAYQLEADIADPGELLVAHVLFDAQGVGARFERYLIQKGLLEGDQIGFSLAHPSTSLVTQGNLELVLLLQTGTFQFIQQPNVAVGVIAANAQAAIQQVIGRGVLDVESKLSHTVPSPARSINRIELFVNDVLGGVARPGEQPGQPDCQKRYVGVA